MRVAGLSRRGLAGAAIWPGRGEAGLTTLGWLLVVAAVAGLAAAGVVVVQNVVTGTAHQVESHSARQQAADLAATELENAWRAHRPSTQDEADQINARYARRCRHLGIIYTDVLAGTDIVEGVYDPNRSPLGWGTGRCAASRRSDDTAARPPAAPPRSPERGCRHRPAAGDCDPSLRSRGLPHWRAHRLPQWEREVDGRPTEPRLECGS